MLGALALAGLAALAAASPRAAQDPPAAVAARAPEEWLVLAPVDGRGRRPFRPDAVFARHLLDPAGILQEAEEAFRLNIRLSEAVLSSGPEPQASSVP